MGCRTGLQSVVGDAGDQLFGAASPTTRRNRAVVSGLLTGCVGRTTHETPDLGSQIDTIDKERGIMDLTSATRLSSQVAHDRPRRHGDRPVRLSKMDGISLRYGDACVTVEVRSADRRVYRDCYHFAS